MQARIGVDAHGLGELCFARDGARELAAQPVVADE
jgi:hypothetical protein